MLGNGSGAVARDAEGPVLFFGNRYGFGKTWIFNKLSYLANLDIS